jgi:ribonucleotide reductase alpha subunit
MEAIYYGAVRESICLAKERGVYESYEGSPTSRGLLQPDMWGVELTNEMFDWDTIRSDLKKYGMRNSMLTALMPTASTSRLLDNTEAFEPITSNVYVRRTLSDNFIVINPYLIKDLKNLKLWNDEMRQRIMYEKGSVQNIDEIPAKIKSLYKKASEMKQKALMDLAVARSPFVCHSQSLNLFMDNPTSKKLISAHFYSWKSGLKTGMYYLRQQPAVDANQITIDPKLKVKWENKKNVPKPVVFNQFPTYSVRKINKFELKPIEYSDCEACSG